MARRGALGFDLLSDWLSLRAKRTASPHLRTERELARIASAARGTVGATGLHIETNRSLSLNADVPLPMASTVKVLIAAHLLWRVDRGDFALDSLVTVDPRHLRFDGDVIASRASGPQVALPLQALIELMLVGSNNTASDALLALGGGAEAVVGWLSSLGHKDITVNRSIGQLIADAVRTGRIFSG